MRSSSRCSLWLDASDFCRRTSPSARERSSEREASSSAHLSSAATRARSAASTLDATASELPRMIWETHERACSSALHARRVLPSERHAPPRGLSKSIGGEISGFAAAGVAANRTPGEMLVRSSLSASRSQCGSSDSCEPPESCLSDGALAPRRIAFCGRRWVGGLEELGALAGLSPLSPLRLAAPPRPSETARARRTWSCTRSFAPFSSLCNDC